MELGLSSGTLGFAGRWAENKWWAQEELEGLLDGESEVSMLGDGSQVCVGMALRTLEVSSSPSTSHRHGEWKGENVQHQENPIL